MKPRAVVIKKYENRRLYDTTNSRYVNLDEVSKMLQNGDSVRVVDASTGDDITRLILTQIIVEDAKAPDSAFPLDVLRQMVIASGRASQESALTYMKAMLDISQNTIRAIAPPVSPLVSPLLNPFEFLPRKNASGGADDSPPTAPVASDAVAPRTASSTGPVPPAAAAPDDDSAPAANPEAKEVDELKRRLAELETIVSSLAPKKVRRKKK